MKIFKNVSNIKSIYLLYYGWRREKEGRGYYLFQRCSRPMTNRGGEVSTTHVGYLAFLGTSPSKPRVADKTRALFFLVEGIGHKGPTS